MVDIHSQIAQAKCYQKSREKRLEYQREYNQNNKERRKKQQREYYKRNRPLDMVLNEEEINELKEKATTLLEQTFK